MHLAITALELPSADVVVGSVVAMTKFIQNVNVLRYYLNGDMSPVTNYRLSDIGFGKSPNWFHHGIIRRG